MLQFGSKNNATAVALCTALLCLGLSGCKETTTPPDGWGDLGSEPFVPENQPSDALCEGDWCWIHPAPFGYDARELRPVDGEVYGVGGISIGGPGKPFIWGDEIQVVDIPSQILDDGRYFYLSIGEDAWLAATQEAVLYEFGPDGVRDTFQLPEVHPRLIKGHSTSLFMASTFENGVYLRRAGELTQWEAESTTRDDRIWPNGDVWRTGSSGQREPPEEDWLRTFPAPQNPEPNSYDELTANWLGPDPSGRCATLGVFASVEYLDLFKWDESNGTWADVPYEFNRGTSDFACRDDGTLIVSSVQGGLYAYSDGSWRRFKPGVNANLYSTATSNGTVYAGGAGGNLIEASESGVRNRRTQILAGNAFDDSGVFADLWVSPDETVAMAFTLRAIHRWTAEGTQDVSNGVDLLSALNTLVVEHSGYEIWGDKQPEFALTPVHVLRWNGSMWKESPLSAQRDDDEFQPIAIAGQAADDVIVATSRKLYHYAGSSWTHISSQGTQVAETIQGAEVGIGDVMAQADGSYLVAQGANIYIVETNDGSWEIQLFRDTPCERLGTLYRAETGELWVQGASNCFARWNDGDWKRYDTPGALERSLPDAPSPDDWQYVPRATFVKQPDSNLPLIGGRFGLLRPTQDGDLRLINRFEISDLAYLPEANITVAVDSRGILAKYH